MDGESNHDVIPVLSWRGSPMVKRTGTMSSNQNTLNNDTTIVHDESYELTNNEMVDSLEQSGGGSDNAGDLEEYWSKIVTISHREKGVFFLSINHLLIYFFYKL